MLRKDVARPASFSTMALRSEDPKRDSSCDGFKPKDLPESSCSKGVFYLRAHLVSGCGYEASSAVQHEQVTINVGGLRFALPWEALADVPISRLGRLRLCSSHDDVLALCDDYDIACNEFFFDRSPCAFRAVLAFLRAGKLHLQPDSCSLSFRDELHYWGVCEECLEPCCLRALQQRADEEAAAAAAAEAQDTFQDTSAAAVEGATSGFIRALRDIVERPQSGLAGKVFACLSVAFVVITVVSLCVGTMPDMREEERKGTCSQKCYDIFVVETVCVAWFSLELTLRFIQAPDKCQFARSPLNMIDVIAILPYYVSLIIDAFSTSDRNFYLEKVGLVLRVLRALRMMYVMRLARHSLGLQTLGLTMRRCTHEFGLLLLFLCVALSLFAPLAFLIEKEVGNHANFTSIPASYWWAVISMTTVGYGDMVPHSFPGQLVALCGILSGILLMAFPVTSIFHSFSHSYVDLKEQYQRLRRREIREAALSPDFGPDLQTGTGMRSRTPPDLTL